MSAVIEQGSPTTHVALCNEITELSKIYDEQTTLAILQRPYQEELAAIAKEVYLAQPLVFAASPKQASQLLKEHLTASNPDIDNLDALITDMAQWIEVYSALLEPSELGLRLASLERAMCPAFHTDYIGIRLVTTYSGSGTEFLSRKDINAEALGYPGRQQTLEESGLLKKQGVIQHVQPQAIALLKGDAWPGNKGNGIVHRSPDVESGKRLVLTLDAHFAD